MISLFLEVRINFSPFQKGDQSNVQKYKFSDISGAQKSAARMGSEQCGYKNKPIEVSERSGWSSLAKKSIPYETQIK